MTATPFSQPSALKGSADPEGGDGAYTFDGKPDRWKRYRLPDPETGKATGFTRATTFAKSISDTFTLSQWSQRMVAVGLAQRGDLLMSVASTPVADRNKLNQLAEEAKNAAGAKVGANLGTALHAFSEALDRGETPTIPPPYQPHMKAYTALIEQYDLEVVEIEKVVLCQTYGIAGTLDRIVRFRRDVTVETVGGGSHTFPAGTLAILDLKTGKDLEYGWLEISIQLALYANAEVIWDKEKLSYSMMYPGIDRKVALVVHLPATAPGDTVKATMYAVDIESGWADADLCAQVREARKKKGIATALSVVEESGIKMVQPEVGDEVAIRVESERVPTVIHKTFDPTGNPDEDADNGDVPVVRIGEVRPPTFVEQAQAARTVEELATLWFTAMHSRQATDELAVAIRARKEAILADTAAG